MNGFSFSTKTIIEKMGYSCSADLFYYNDIYTNNNLSFHDVKVLKELKPCAFYCINQKPFVLFFDKVNSNEMKELSRKIWNSQIPVVIINDESTIKIYNGSSLDKDYSLIDFITQHNIDECNEFSPFSYWNIVDQGFWGDFEERYSSKKLNETLLENIEYVTNTLREYKIKYPTKLILRLIFIRFLIDRAVDIGYGNFTSDVKKSQGELLEVVRNKTTLYSLFSHLKDKFNGNLFELKDEVHDANLTQDVLDLLHDFLSGELILSTGQFCLFPMYDFNIIPVELISNIYEILLGKDTQSRDKAFYTPSYLVDYILKETVVPHLYKNSECKILDPACGSGIFLVECFRHIVENSKSECGYFNDVEKLKHLLLRNIYGIDKNDEAIDVTIFSLYLTILDYIDPKTLVDFKLPNVKDENLIVGNFFDDEKTEKLKQKEFNFIIGNPPWGSVKDDPHVKYCKQNNKPQFNDEISRSFVYKSEEFCTDKTVCCFVLPSKLLYNSKSPSMKFRQLLLSSTKIEKILELSSVRKLVFKNADAPAIIMIFKRDNSSYLKNKITHVSFKPNIFFKLFNIIVIEKNDIKMISQSLLYQNDWAWKTVVYGNSWDYEIISNIKNKYPTIEQIIEDKNNELICGVGIQDHTGDGLDSSHLIGKPILSSDDGINHFSIITNTQEIFNKNKIHRPRNPELFKPPYCFVKKGVNCENYKMRAAYSEDEYVFKETVFAIKSSLDKRNILLNLTGLINSSFFSYLNLMLGSSIGIEREQRFTEEILHFPYLYSDKIREKVALIQDLRMSYEIDDIEKYEKEVYALDNLILKLFDLKNNPFIDYALNVQIPLVANANKKLYYTPVNKDNLIKYSEVFIQYFERIYLTANKYIKVNIYPEVMKKFSVFELIICDNKPLENITIEENPDNNKRFLTRLMTNKTNDLFYQIKDVINFEENSFFIMKTNEYKNWHPAIAQIDLSDVVDEILSEKGRES